MRVTTERLEHCQVNVIIELEAAEVDEELRDAARKISREFNVPGYRRGHAPFAAVIRTFGRAAVQQQAVEDFGQDMYDAALEEIEYEPYQPGELQEVKWDPFRMTVLLPIVPEVELGDYRAVRLPFETEPVTDEQVEARLKEVQEAHAQWVPVDRTAAMGDQVVVDLTGTVGSKEVLKQEGGELILREKAAEPVPGFPEQIVGMAAGEEKSFALKYPADHSDEELAGKEVAFSVRLQAVKQKELLPLDDDLALMVGDYDTLEDLRAALRQQLEMDAVDAARPAYLDKVLQAMVEQAAKIDYPLQAVERESDRALSRMERDLESAGVKLDRYLQILGKTRETYKAEFRPAAEARLKKRLVLIEVVRQEGLDVTADELEAEIARLTERLGEDSQELREALASPEGRLSVADDLLTTKAQWRVIAIGKGEAPPLEKKEDEVAAEAETGAEAEVPTDESREETPEQAEAEIAQAGETDAPAAEPVSEGTAEADAHEPAGPPEAGTQD
jgi:trigger factor